jgi:hypothetical protein
VIIPTAQTIGDVFKSDKPYVIPKYQRSYNWGKEEATELIEDLMSCSGGDGDALFLGTFIFEATSDKKLCIVDGQQRITTLLLLLVACRMHAKKLGETDQASAIQNKIGFIDQTTGKTSGFRLIASESIRDAFAHVASNTWDGSFPPKINGKTVKRQVNRIKGIYEFFAAFVAKLDFEKLTNFLSSAYGAYVFKIEIESDVQALGIFERTNARGMELEVSDLLKNHLFAKKVDGLEESWGQITENSEGTLLRMLKYFYISKRGAVTKPQLYKKLKSYGNEPEIGAEKLTDQLLGFSKFYRMCRSADHTGVKAYFEALSCETISGYEDRFRSIHSALLGLREFNISQFIPVTFAALESFARNDGFQEKGAAKIFVRLIETMEKYHFVNNAICERVGNEVEKLYAETCVAFAAADDFKKVADQLMGSLRKQKANEDEFVAQFVAKLTYDSGTARVAYAFDRINNFGLTPGTGKEIYNPDPRIFRKSFSIEHFMPQTPDSSVKLDKATAEAIDEIGNLLVVPAKTNSKLGNISPAKKVAKLRGELNAEVKSLKHVEDFLEKYGDHAAAWDGAAIAFRSRDLAEQAYRNIWNF